ncbi:MAG: hypothetical protein M3R38_22130 [Actinomycetota bacterium]|nr:hypothetical protein [Actinomycetota bacterium]
MPTSLIYPLPKRSPDCALDKNVVCDDALFAPWPEADAIVGNPPYQSKNKMQREYGPEYVSRVRDRYPDVPGQADYCVYWFRRAHDHLRAGGRAGLVGTNTIRQNKSREGSLQYIAENGGTITEAVSTQVWSGEAVVHVSIANWVKGEQGGTKRLYRQLGDRWDSDFEVVELERINAALSGRFDVTGAKELRTNAVAPACFQGQTPGHDAFLVEPAEAEEMVRLDPKSAEVLFPYLTGDDLVGRRPPSPSRYVVDFHPRDVLTSGRYAELLRRVQNRVLPDRKAKAEEEERKDVAARERGSGTRVNRHHRNFYKRWWHLSYPRADLKEQLLKIPRYIACGRVTRRPIFEFVDSAVRPSDALQVFPLPDDYSFGVLQSGIHWLWFVERCSTLKSDFRYTSNTVFDAFPWPQAPKQSDVEAVANAATGLRSLRTKVVGENGWSYRELYSTLDLPGEHPLKDAHAALDAAVRAAYGMSAKEDPLAFLLALNAAVHEKELAGEGVTGPGLPESIADRVAFVGADRVSARLPW